MPLPCRLLKYDLEPGLRQAVSLSAKQNSHLKSWIIKRLILKFTHQTKGLRRKEDSFCDGIINTQNGRIDYR